MGLLWRLFVGPPHPDDAALLRLLEQHRATLEPVGETLLRAADGTIVAADDPAAALGPTLRRTGVLRAIIDHDDGGVLFVVASRGVAVSGSEAGLVFAPPDAPPPPGARVVVNLAEGLAAAKRAAPKHQEVSALFVRPVAGRWSIFLDTR